jgi:hypothetical protein
MEGPHPAGAGGDTLGDSDGPAPPGLVGSVRPCDGRCGGLWRPARADSLAGSAGGPRQHPALPYRARCGPAGQRPADRSHHLSRALATPRARDASRAPHRLGGNGPGRTVHDQAGRVQVHPARTVERVSVVHCAVEPGFAASLLPGPGVGGMDVDRRGHDAGAIPQSDPRDRLPVRRDRLRRSGTLFSGVLAVREHAPLPGELQWIPGPDAHDQRPRAGARVHRFQ